ncbi:MAG: hypothetical protein ABSA12_01180 [Verrucomicrobiia bacterium]|jgi:DNA-binding PadR family transcriptional regulator
MYDLIVLDVLRDGPNYGYGIRKRIFEAYLPNRFRCWGVFVP